MFEVKVEASFAAAHRLMYHPGACRRLHGHNYRVFAVLEAEQLLQPSEMVVDMKTLRGALTAVLEKYDHTTILNVHDPLGTLLAREDMKVELLASEPTAELMAKLFHEELGRVLLSDIRICSDGNEPPTLKVVVYETEKGYASCSGSLQKRAL